MDKKTCEAHSFLFLVCISYYVGDNQEASSPACLIPTQPDHRFINLPFIDPEPSQMVNHLILISTHILCLKSVQRLRFILKLEWAAAETPLTIISLHANQILHILHDKWIVRLIDGCLDGWWNKRCLPFHPVGSSSFLWSFCPVSSLKQIYNPALFLLSDFLDTESKCQREGKFKAVCLCFCTSVSNSHPSFRIISTISSSHLCIYIWETVIHLIMCLFIFLIWLYNL